MSLFTKSNTGTLIQADPDDIRRSSGVQVNLFRQLLVNLAELGVANPDHAILLRGQRNDHRDANGLSLVNPTIFRPQSRNLSELESQLTDAQQMLRAEVGSREQIPDAEKSALTSPLIAQAILQHYEVVPTPWLDLTDSAHMAAHFGLGGLIYAFAIPRDRMLFSRRAASGLVCRSLSSLCPSCAWRPHFQRAFVLANIRPSIDENNPPIAAFAPDLSQYLLCKFQISWSQFQAELQLHFGAPQSQAVSPPADPMRNICQTIREHFA
jgi:FRG domain-containing protein